MSWFTKHWTAIAGLFLTALFIYLQLVQWQRHGDDLMLTAISIVVTVALWATLIIAIGKYWKSSNRNEALEATLAAIKDEHTTHTNHFVRQLASKQDEISEMERRYREEIKTLKQTHLTEMEQRRLGLLEELQARYPAKTAITKTDAKPVDAPQLLIRYLKRHLRGEMLVFINDGGGAIIEPKVGPLRWSEHREIGILGNAGVLETGRQQEHDVWLMETESVITQLYEFMRTKTPHDANTSVTITYRNSSGQHFARDFMLTSQLDSNITWSPGPTRRVSAAEVLSEPA